MRMGLALSLSDARGKSAIGYASESKCLQRLSVWDLGVSSLDKALAGQEEEGYRFQGPKLQGGFQGICRGQGAGSRATSGGIMLPC